MNHDRIEHLEAIVQYLSNDVSRMAQKLKSSLGRELSEEITERCHKLQIVPEDAPTTYDYDHGEGKDSAPNTIE